MNWNSLQRGGAEVELWPAWKTWLRENSMVSTMKEGWCAITSLTSKDDAEGGNQHFVNSERTVWAHWWLQKAAVTRCQHYKNTAHPSRPVERGQNTDETKSLEGHSQILSIASAKIPAPGALLFPRPDNEEGNHNSSHLPGHLHAGHCADRNCQDRHRPEQMCVTLL